MLAAVTPVHVHFRPLRYVPVLIDLQVGQTFLCDSYRGISTMRRRAAKVCAIAQAYSAEAIEILGSKSTTDLGQALPNLQISPACVGSSTAGS